MKFLLLLIAFSGSLFAQQEYTLHFNRDLVQSQHTNPAFRNKAKFSILLPSVAFNYGNNAFSYRDLVRKNPSNDSTFLDIDNVLSKMSDRNILQLQSEIDVIGLYYTYEDWYFSMFLTEKMDAKFSYSKNLVDLLWNGNAKFVGKTIEIGPGLHMNYLKELSFGIGRQLDKWDLGVNIKLISGMANVSSEKSSLTLTTATDDYAMTLNTDYKIRTSGTYDPFSQLLLPPKNFNNPGIGIDLGVVFKPNDKWELAQSVLDLGAVHWKNDVVTYKSQGTFTFSGVDIAEFIDDEEIYFDDFRDSIKSLYFDEDKGGDYWDYLVPETYSSALYKLDDKTNFGALVHLMYFTGVQFGISLYAGRQLMKYVDIGLSYNIKNRRYDNVGLNLSLGPKVFKVFVVTDNLFNFLAVRNGRNVTFRYGMNISIGNADKPKERPALEPNELNSTED